MTISFELDEDALATLCAAAESAGERDAASLARRMVLERCEEIKNMTRGQRAVERMRRVPHNGMTADEIMEMTRSEV